MQSSFSVFCVICGSHPLFGHENISMAIIRAVTHENRSLGFPTSSDTNLSVQSRIKARRLKFRI